MGRIDVDKIDYIISSIENLEYGTLVITVHNGQVTQIDATEKKRFDHAKVTK
ncbi:hypothetical protein SAMN04488134_103185 [Amphibacillus marinus]|uniref:DUF2292 domain-containing protein n=1 Tax=Amphibacillus marinus TaxID=872970 RepID=A0A1H8LF18_9BACI|nr:YezD family protein [Amphibacillus marinus]SEO03697.1 hypothetical protein SAMN04488134_103185 [Amphibacillus marinus]